jgi:hypothetical protein
MAGQGVAPAEQASEHAARAREVAAKEQDEAERQRTAEPR